VIQEDAGNEKEQDGNLTSEPVAKTPAIPTVVPASQKVMPPKDIGSEPTAQSGQGNPPHHPEPIQPIPGFGGVPHEIPINTFKQINSPDQDMLRATCFGIFVAGIAAFFFYLQFKEMGYQTKILSIMPSLMFPILFPLMLWPKNKLERFRDR
jgi:hypothetical protein